MMDEAEKCGIKIDTERLSELLGVPVIETAAAEGKNLDNSTLIMSSKNVYGSKVLYGDKL